MRLDGLFTDGAVSVQVMKSADNEALNGVGVDMLGLEGVVFIASALKGEALDFEIKAQQDTDSAYGSAADLAGTAVEFSTTVSADAYAVLQIHRPVERYVRPVLTVPDASSATPVSVIAITYGSRSLPVTNTGEIHVSPAEGTA